jgi:hypothetical protein
MNDTMDRKTPYLASPVGATDLFRAWSPANDSMDRKTPYLPSPVGTPAPGLFRTRSLVNDPAERKMPRPAPAVGAPDLLRPQTPVHYPVGEYAENDPRSGHCLPEVVIGPSPAQPSSVGQQQPAVSPSRSQSPRPYTPNVETMSMTMAPTHFLTVTPLHLLGDQPDIIDCPFCLRRAETKVIREASPVTHAMASLCCLTTVFGVIAPYMLEWAAHIEQHCTNCNRRVTRKPHGKTELQVFGTPSEQRIPSRYPAAEFPLEDEVPPPPPAKEYTRPNDARPNEAYGYPAR